NATMYYLDDFVSGVVRLIDFDQIEVRTPLGLIIQLRHLTMVDAMRINHDAALRRLAKDFGQTRRGDYRRVYDVSQHLAWTHRRQLVRITYQQKSRLRRQRPDDRRHQRYVHHRNLIHHQQVASERIGLAAFETTIARVGFEQTMDGLGG